MRRMIVSYTLERPGQNYPIIYQAIDALSSAFAHVDESEFLILTPFSEDAVELALSAVMDFNDSLRIFGVSSVRTLNCTIAWQEGAQRTPQGRLETRAFIAQLLEAGRRMNKRRA